MGLLRSFLQKRSKREPEGELFAQVRGAMSDVQAYARSHGGKIHLIDVTDEGEVQIRLTGACDGCPMADLTIRLGIEAQLRRIVPGVQRVTQVA